MAFDPFNDRYKDTNTIYDRNLRTWLWLWLPFYGLFRLSGEAYAKFKENRSKNR